VVVAPSDLGGSPIANGHVLMEQGCCVSACEEHVHPHVTCFERGRNVGLGKRGCDL
jgi:hypothetical protein